MMHPYLIEKEMARREAELRRSLLLPRDPSRRLNRPVRRSAAGMARALRSVADRLDPVS
jgi:hypothetical protein